MGLNRRGFGLVEAVVHQQTANVIQYKELFRFLSSYLL
jgi:hypothetical protein